MLRNEVHMRYALKQHKKIYRSTVYFEKFISKFVSLKNKRVVDLACGAGANTMYLGAKYPNSNFLGADIEKKVLNQANKINYLENVSFKKLNWLKLKKKDFKKFNGLVSFQTISVLPFWYNKSIQPLLNFNLEFLAFSGSLYDGDCEYKILVDDFSEKSEVGKTYHNICPG